MSFFSKNRKPVPKASVTQQQSQPRLAAVSTNPNFGVFKEPPASIISHVAYRVGSTTGKSFERIAIDLMFTDEVSMSRVVKEFRATRARNEPKRIADCAIDLGVLDEQAARTIAAAQILQIFVDTNAQSSPAFITWTDDLKKRGFPLDIQPLLTGELIDKRDQLNSKNSGEDDRGLDQINAAIELFLTAIKIHASDIKIVVLERIAKVLIRTRGDYREAKAWEMDRASGERLIRAIYVGLATVKPGSYEPFEYQDAQIAGRQKLPGTGLESIRLIRGPMYPIDQHCSFMVARLQYNPDDVFDVSASLKLLNKADSALKPLNMETPDAPDGEFQVPGMTPLQRGLFEELIYKPNGLVVVTGPTGSGKTSTLFQAMKEQARRFPTTSQITIENPPEYPQPWAITLAVDKKNSFQDMIRYSLRMDPDILLVGEIRSGDEGVAAIQAAMTGHFVWTTLHVTDPYMTLGRLETLDHVRLSRAITCDHELFVGFVAQRIVQVMCPDCRIPLSSAGNVPTYMRDRLSTWGDLDSVFVSGCGCPTCGTGAGVIGREAVMEVVLTDEAFMNDYKNFDMRTARKNHRMKPGSDKSMLGNAMTGIFDGRYSPLDVHRNVSSIVSKMEGV